VKIGLRFPCCNPAGPGGHLMPQGQGRKGDVMNGIAACLAGLIRHRGGATAIEYAIIAALVALALVGSLRLLGPSVAALLGDPDLLSALAGG
jgi:Flp pilus assembly pilin Flp